MTAKSRRRTIVLLVGVVAAIAIGRQALYYAADPAGDKDCAPIAPRIVRAVHGPISDELPMSGGLRWTQRGGSINDVSCLNPTPVDGIVDVKQVEDVSQALTFARANGLKVSIAGARHSQGGQAFASKAVVLDMRGFKAMSLDENAHILTVQSGATWH